MKKRMSTSISLKAEPKRQRLFTHRFLPMILLLSAAFFIGSAFIITDYKERILGWGSVMVLQYTRPKMCETQCRAYRSEALPRGIISETSDLEMRPSWGLQNKKKSKSSMNLLAIAVGIKQKESVNKIVKKFPVDDFIVMLFHYDGIVDQWKDLEWNDRAIHMSAANQTKWWFAKRFLHPDIVSEYSYIFLWDEDLGVDHFNAKRRAYKVIGRTRCNENSTGPPCTGFVEMMAPLFSRASWRCAWHMIQGDQTQKIGIVDAEYLVHNALPTLGGLAATKVSSPSGEPGGRSEAKKKSFIELEIFKNRWKRAVKQDNCCSDPYEQSTKNQN
ncbi:hypothetical protein REPUB_Repub17cG0045900 [Reevesia pubescens]